MGVLKKSRNNVIQGWSHKWISIAQSLLSSSYQLKPPTISWSRKTCIIKNKKKNLEGVFFIVDRWLYCIIFRSSHPIFSPLRCTISSWLHNYKIILVCVEWQSLLLQENWYILFPSIPYGNLLYLHNGQSFNHEVGINNLILQDDNSK